MEVRALLTALKEQEMDKTLEQLEAELVVARSEATVAVETMAEAWAMAMAKARDKDNVVESIKAEIVKLKEQDND